GGVMNLGGTMSLSNVTISGNTAVSNGGGLYNFPGSLSMTNVTISGNSAATGGGVDAGTAVAISLTNTIVAGQSAGGDISGMLDPGSATTLVGDGSGMTGISDGSQGNQVGTHQAPINPLLAPLGDYGGTTSTLALLPGSPAIGGGASGPGVPANDQRGRPRPR